MSQRRVVDLAVAVGALLSLAALLLVPPVLLVVSVGWPLPTEVPALDELSEAARRGVEDAVFVKALASIAWLAWLQIALAVATESVAIARGRVARRLPVPGGVQRGIARLVATVMLLLAATGPVRAAAAPVTAPPVAGLVVDPSRPEAVDISGRSSASTGEAVPADLPRYEVRRHDTLWSIAERALGDGMRWREVLALNVGRPLATGAVMSQDGDFIEPGWVLALPAGADLALLGYPAESFASPPGVVDEATTIVERGDHLWSIAEEAMAGSLERSPAVDEVWPYWQQVVAVNAEQFADPSVVFAGQELLLPAIHGGSAAPSATESAPDPPVPHGPPSTVPRPAPSTPADGETGRSDAVVSGDEPAGTDRGRAAEGAETDSAAEEFVGPVLLGLAGAGIAVGVARAVRRRRRQRLLQLPPGASPPNPDARHDELRTDIVLQSDEDLIESLGRHMRALGVALSTTDPTVRPRLIQATEEGVEVLLSRPVPAYPGWRSEADDAVWVSEDPDLGGDDAELPSPLLVSIGRAEDSGQLYLDLEGEHLVLVAGNEQATMGFARSLVLELAHSVLAEGASIVVVGEILGSPLRDLDRVRTAVSWDDVADDVLSWAGQSRAVLAARERATGFAGRASGPPVDGLAPLVVVCAGVPLSPSFSLACDLVAAGDTAVTLVALGDELAGATRIELSDGELIIPTLDLACRAQVVKEETVDQVVALLADAERLPDPEEDEFTGQLPLLPDVAEPGSDALDIEDDEVYSDPPHHIRVRLLGDVEVLGGARPLTPKQTAVMAYIALHAPVATERVEDAVWTTPTASRRKRLLDTVSECRASLGAEQLPAATDGRYRLGNGTRTDLDLFERRVTAAKGQPAEVAIDILQGAVDLIEGPPLTYRTAASASYVWVDLENWQTIWELKLTATTRELADLLLESGRFEEAASAAQRGLLASPLDTGLTEALMQAYTASGDRLSAERVYQNHVASLEKLEIDHVAESTNDLRDRLRSGGDDAAASA